MLILTTYFGHTGRFERFLAPWLQSVRPYGTPVLITDQPREHALVCSTNGWEDCLRAEHPFDIKGALLCDALNRIPPDEDAFLVDLDATILRDPRPMLKRFAGVPIAMTMDSGAILYGNAPFFTGAWSAIPKRNSGIIWFGASPDRVRIGLEYRKGWHELLDGGLPWRPLLPHLLEQHAWTMANHRLGAATLPAVLNWSSRFLGSSPEVLIDHDFGWGKWGSDVPKNM